MKTIVIALLTVVMTALPAFSQVPKPGFGDEGCPDTSLFAENVSITGEDYIEVDVLQSFIPLPLYTARVYGDGRVVWHGVKYVSVMGDASETADATQARMLIAKARELGFGSLCNKYVARGFDGGHSVTKVSIGGKTKVVTDEGVSNAPHWLNILSEGIAALAPVQKLIGTGKPAGRHLFSPAK